MPEDPRRRAVGEGHAPRLVEADHPRGDRGQHRIEQPPAALDPAVGVHQRLALRLQLPGHLVEDAPQHRDLVVALLLDHLHVEVAAADPLRRPREPPHRPRQPLGEPQAQPDRGKDQDHRKAEIEQAELEHEPPALALELGIEPRRLGGVVEKPQDAAVHRAADVEIAVDIVRQRQQRAVLGVVDILDQDDTAILRGGHVGLARALEVEQVGAFAARPDLAGAVDDIALLQPALDQPLALRQKLSQLAIVDEEVLLPRRGQESGQRAGIDLEIVALILAVGFGGGERGADHAANPVGEPALETHVHRQPGKDRHRHRGDQRDQREHPGQPQVQPRARRFRPPRRDHPRDGAGHQRRHHQHVDEVAQQHEAELQRRRALVERSQHPEGQERENRPEDDKSEGGEILRPTRPRQPQKAVDGRPSRHTCHRVTSTRPCRAPPRPPDSVAVPRPEYPRADRQRRCCGFTSTFGGVSRGYRAR